MKHYKRMFIWQNTHRLRKLISFGDLVVRYFNNLKPLSFLELQENNEAREARAEINLVMDEAYRFIIEAGVTPIIDYSPPPAVGGLGRSIDVVHNIFNLHRFQIPPQQLLDFIHRAVGVYQNDSRKALLRTINPLFWIYLVLDFLASTPFRLLGLAGFNRSKIEHSFIGRILRLLFTLVMFGAAFLTILQILGYIEKFKGWIMR